jgi:hypothetical protein
MVVGRKWQFKARYRANAYGWRGTSLAVSRLKEAVSEIKAVAKSDPVAAGDGVVSLMERIWPAFQDIDTSSGVPGRRLLVRWTNSFRSWSTRLRIMRPETSGSNEPQGNPCPFVFSK